MVFPETKMGLGTYKPGKSVDRPLPEKFLSAAFYDIHRTFRPKTFKTVLVEEIVLF